MLLPYNTDAPIYHLPIVTVGLIVTSIATLAASSAGLISDEQVKAYWTLSYGNGLHPTQWLFSSLMDTGWVHLITNVIFLWSFGLIVEGKLGWWKFLLVVLAIVVGESAIEQILLLRAHSESGRIVTTSPLVYGLLAMCLVWAPRNNLSCLLFYNITAKQVDVAILTFGAMFIGVQLLFLLLIDAFSIGEAALQLIGATLGAIIAVVLHKTKVVDCEGWDLFSVIAGRDTAATVYNERERDKQAREDEFHKLHKGKPSRSSATKGQPKSPAGPSQITQQASAQIDVYLQQGNAVAAGTLYKKLGGAEAGISLDEKQLVAIIQGLLKAQKWSDAAPLMAEYLKAYPDKSTKMRLKLAEVLIQHLRRLETGRRVLEKLPATLPEPLAATRQSLLAAAAQLEDDADLEIDRNEDW